MPVILLGFDGFFLRFHEVFFSGSSWRFSDTDTLLRIYPEVFWQDTAKLAAGIVVVQAVIVGLAAWWWWVRRVGAASPERLVIDLHRPAGGVLRMGASGIVEPGAGCPLAAMDRVRDLREFIASVILYFFLQSGDFAHAFDNFMIAMVVWVSPWAGVTLADYFLVRRGRVEIGELYATPDTSRYGDVNWAGVISFALGLIAAWAFQMGTITIMQGPLALATGGVDLSWLTGMIAAGASYLVLHPLRGRPVASTGQPSAIDAFPGDVESFVAVRHDRPMWS